MIKILILIEKNLNANNRQASFVNTCPVYWVRWRGQGIRLDTETAQEVKSEVSLGTLKY